MKTVTILCVGRLKAPYWRDAAAYYAKLLSRHMRLECVEVKDGPARLSPEERTEAEGRSLLAKLGPKLCGVALDERGPAMDSPGLARLLKSMQEDPARSPCFVIGGAFGLSAEVQAACPQSLSLGRLTFTHEIARVLLMEQIYRATSILKNLPYHHA